MTTTAFALPNPLALNLEASPLSPRNWPFSLDCLPETAHLVGGVVRDALLGREPEYLDLDFVLPEGSVEIAQAIARQYKAGFVVLDAERQIARVVFSDATVDFALQEGDSLEQDLQRRDFTINAIAYSPHREALVDPVDGYEDILRRRLRMISRENLEDDPLRLLRAYRQAAQLGFEVERDTDRAIGELSDRIAPVAAERVQSELNTLLSHPQGLPWLKRAWQAGLLRTWLPDLDRDGLSRVACLGELAAMASPDLAGLFTPPASFQKSSLGKDSCLPVAKLVALCAVEPELAESQAQGLKYSRLEMRAAGSVRRLQHLLRSPQMSIRDQFFLFQSAGDLFPVMALVSLAEQLQGQDLNQDFTQNLSLLQDAAVMPTLAKLLSETVLLPLIERYLDRTDPVAHPRPLVSGKSLMKALEIKPGPQIGLLLTELQIAQAEGLVGDEAGAIAWLKANQARLLAHGKA